MQTFLSDTFLESADGQEANRILRSCVHCGFCTATCPTYRLRGDELDSPRGRIYLIKGLLEGEKTTATTRLHLDRCLTCRACETYCPSGVEYGRLLDIGRKHLEQARPRHLLERAYRFVLRRTLTCKPVFNSLFYFGQMLRPVIPRVIRKRIPPRPAPARTITLTEKHQRRIILPRGCVQPALTPQTNQAVMRLLDKLGITAVEINTDTCCGAVDYHMTDGQQAMAYIRKNIDAWWPQIELGAEAIVSTASGCGVMIKEYGYLLRGDPDYAEKAEKVALLTRDISELFTDNDIRKMKDRIQDSGQRQVFQSPCTLQHGQKLPGKVESLLAKLGLNLQSTQDSYLCCGSAGVYSILQPALSAQLQQQKINNLVAGEPDVILTANIGCQLHLQQVTEVPVKHWIEYIDGLVV